MVIYCPGQKNSVALTARGLTVSQLMETRLGDTAEGHFVCACSVWDDLMKVAADTRLFPVSFRLNRSHYKGKQRNGEVLSCFRSSIFLFLVWNSYKIERWLHVVVRNRKIFRFEVQPHILTIWWLVSALTQLMWTLQTSVKGVEGLSKNTEAPARSSITLVLPASFYFLESILRPYG